MLRSFNSLALRQLRTRPLRSALTAFGVVLGVGMVFGVLLLVGTIRATFDEVIDSAWGETDLVVMGEGSGTMAENTLDRINEVVSRQIGATRLLRSRVMAQRAPTWRAGRRLTTPQLRRLKPAPGTGGAHRWDVSLTLVRETGREPVGVEPWAEIRRR